MVTWIAVADAMPEFFPDNWQPDLMQVTGELLLWIPRYGAYRGGATKLQDGTVMWNCAQVPGDIRVSHWARILTPQGIEP